MSHKTLFVDNDTLLNVGTTTLPLTNRANDSVVSGASVVASVQTTTGGLVSGATSILLSETTDSGVYQGTLDSTAALALGSHYEIVYTVSGGAGEDAKWTVSAQGRERYQ